MQLSEYPSIDAYIEGSAPEFRDKLKSIRDAIRRAAPEASERFAYGMPTFFLEGNLVHFATAKSHIGFYPSPSGVDRFNSELPGYKTSKGAVQLPLDGELPIAVIESVTRFRVAENLAKAEAKRHAKKAAKA